MVGVLVVAASFLVAGALGRMPLLGLVFAIAVVILGLVLA